MSLFSRFWTSPAPRASRKAVAGAALGVLMATGSIGGAIAQDATPSAGAALPDVGSCLAPAADVAAATPEAAVEVTDPAAIDGATAALATYYGCVTTAASEASWGLTFQPASILSIWDNGNDTWSVVHQVTIGSQLDQATAIVSGEPGALVVNSVTSEDVELSGDVITLTIGFAGADPAVFTPGTAEALPNVRFSSTNNSVTDTVGVLVVQLPEGFDATTYDGTTALPAESTPIGYYWLAPGEVRSIAFQGLLPGNYGVIASTGENAVLSLTEPAELDVPDIFASPEATPGS